MIHIVLSFLDMRRPPCLPLQTERDLSSQVDALNTELSSAQRRLDEAHGELEALRADKTLRSMEVVELGKRVNDVSAALTEATNKVEMMNERLFAVTAERDDLAGRFPGLSAEVESLREKLESEQTFIQNHIKSMRETIDALNAKCAELSASLDERTGELNDARATSASLQVKLGEERSNAASTLQSALEDASTSRATLEAVVSALRSEIKGLTSRIDDAAADVAAARTDAAVAAEAAASAVVAQEQIRAAAAAERAEAVALARAEAASMLAAAENAVSQAQSEAEAARSSAAAEAAAAVEATRSEVAHELAEAQRAVLAAEAVAAAAKASAAADADAAITVVREEAAAEVAAVRESVAAAAAAAAARDAASQATLATTREAVRHLGGSMRALSVELKSALAASGSELEAMGAALSSKVAAAAAAAADANRRYLAEAAERRRLFNRISELRGNIRVLARVRPLLPNEGASDSAAAVRVVGPYDIIVGEPAGAATTSSGATTPGGGGPAPDKSFEFDRCFGPSASQEDVFEEVKPMITSALDGFHACVFAYGQTGR